MRFQRFSRDYTTYFEVFFEFWRTKTKQTKKSWISFLVGPDTEPWGTPQLMTDWSQWLHCAHTCPTNVYWSSVNWKLQFKISQQGKRKPCVALKACLFFICVHGIIEWGNRIYLLNTPPPVACRRHDRLPCDNGSTWRNLGETTLRCRESTGERLRRIRDKRSDLLSTNTLPPFVEAADKDVWEGDLCSAGSSWR